MVPDDVSASWPRQRRRRGGDVRPAFAAFAARLLVEKKWYVHTAHVEPYVDAHALQEKGCTIAFYTLYI